ncbi:MAG: zinc ribbon domain-containing protein [Spirochaetales bacterium]|nr:zinc ribbon domain-containing protein [Candidatus Physcosoma equi]
MKYLDIKDTPLRFHKLYSRWILPLDSFLSLVSVFTLMQAMVTSGAGLWDLLDLGAVLVFLVLCFSAFRGLMSFRRSGLYATYGLLTFQILDNAYRAWSYLGTEDAYLGYAAIMAMGILSLVLYYYWKRRKLFTKDGLTLEQLLEVSGLKVQDAAFKSRYESAMEAYEAKQEVEAEVEEEEEIGEYDCPRCGHHITDGAVFCPKCGAQTRAVRR